MKLYLATGNPHKLTEVRAILSGALTDIEVIGADSVGGMPEVDESAEDFRGNALIKARALRKQVPEGAMVVADDSGLCVDCLDGAPGVRSSRYAGEGATDTTNTDLLLERMSGIPLEQRSAHFRCVIVLIEPDGSEHAFDGRCAGRINLDRSGDGGFGYDPVFQPDGYKSSFAVLPEDEKNRISHRSTALKQMGEWMGGRDLV